MYCFRCGKKLPPRVVNCPECDTPQKRRKRYRTRMILGLFIFLAGAFFGSLFDSLIFKGKILEHTFLDIFGDKKGAEHKIIASATAYIEAKPADNVLTVAKEKVNINADIEGQDNNIVLPRIAADISEDSSQVTIEENPKPAKIETNIEVAQEVVATPARLLGVIAASETEAIAEISRPASETVGRLVYDSFEVFEDGSTSSYHGIFSRDGEEMIFSSNRFKVDGKHKYQCLIKTGEASSNPERAFEWKGNVWTPEFTPERKEIVFSSDSKRPEHIFIYDRASKKAIALTKGKSKNMMPSVSPDGKLITFVSNKGGSNNIWIMGINGENLIQITNSSEDDREPRWGPDGKSIVFTRIFRNFKKSYIMRIQLEPMGKPKAMVEDESRNWLADISPDGSTLAFVRSQGSGGSKNTIFLKDLKTQEEISVKPIGNAEYFRPVWLKHQDGFIFHANKNNKKVLYVARFKREK